MADAAAAPIQAKAARNIRLRPNRSTSAPTTGSSRAETSVVRVMA
jgi:hypothetical protein